MKEFVNKIKRRENAFYAALYLTAKSILYFSLPINTFSKPLFHFIYIVHISLREIIKVIAKTIYFEPMFRSQCVSVGRHLQMERLPYIIGFGNIKIGNNVNISGKPNIMFSNKIEESPDLLISGNTFIGHNTSFNVARSITIGSHCLIAENVEFRDNDGHPFDYLARRANHPPEASSVKPIVVHDDVWIGSGALILKGVTIGARSVIAARSVVTSDVPSDVIAAGAPAKVIRQINIGLEISES